MRGSFPLVGALRAAEELFIGCRSWLGDSGHRAVSGSRRR
jgi:hypothetical protein